MLENIQWDGYAGYRRLWRDYYPIRELLARERERRVRVSNGENGCTGRALRAVFLVVRALR